MKITKYFLVLSFLSLTYVQPAEISEGDLLVQMEEGFRSRDNLTFNFRGNSQQDKLLHCVPIHDILLEFEKTQKGLLIEKKGEGFKTKNLATFGMTVVIKKGEKLTFITLLPEGQEGRVVWSNTPQLHHIAESNNLLKKVFVSGLYLNESQHRREKEAREQNETSWGIFQSLSAVVADSTMWPADYLIGDLYAGLVMDKGSREHNLLLEHRIPSKIETKKENFNGIFSEELKYEKGPNFIPITNCLRLAAEANRQLTTTPRGSVRYAGLISEQYAALNSPVLSKFWGASLFDSEQSLRIYFQSKVKRLLARCLELYDEDNTSQIVQSASIDGSPAASSANPKKKNANILGLLLHVHSEMDMCALCTASMDGFMKSCNLHSRKKSDDYRILGRQNYLLYQVMEVLQQRDRDDKERLLAEQQKKGPRKGDVSQNLKPRDFIRLHDDFRFRVTVSSRRPYVRNSYVSKRNWTGKDTFSLQASANETIDFYDDDSHCVHKAYFYQDGHPVLGRILDADRFPVRDRIRGLPGFAQLLPGPVVTSGRAVYALCALQQRLKEEYALFYGRQINGIARLIYGFCDEVEAQPISSGSPGSSSLALSGSGGASSRSGSVTSPTTTTTTTTTSTTSSPTTTSSRHAAANKASDEQQGKRRDSKAG